jgi:hypothetical protein
MSKIAQIYYYDPQSAGINLQSPQSDSTPWKLTLGGAPFLGCMLMNSRGGPPILRGGPPLGTISMDHTVPDNCLTTA